MRKIKIYFPKADITCYATVLEDDFPELADELWEKIAQPMECEAHNTLSTGTTTNPGTGANDVVGVAAALAVVALVSGAAISLKK